MKLCTFEVKTVLGKHKRLGAILPDGILDLNTACAWHFFQQGDAQPYRLAYALLPSTMLAFLQGETTSMETAKAVIHNFQQAIQRGSIPQGLNEETLLFNPNQVILKAPLPKPSSMRDFYAFEQHVKKGFEKRGE